MEVEEQMDSRKQVRSIICSLFMVLFIFPCACAGWDGSPPVFIAHAGGAINGQTYTNSLEALDANYQNGFRFFEMDFSWTADEELVAIHDWDDSFREMFQVPPDLEIPAKARFLQLKTKTGLTQLSLEAVLGWAEEKGDAFIITDFKDDNVKALAKIDADFQQYKKYIVPQVYSYREYDALVKLGYSNIILTLYRMKIIPAELLTFLEENSPFAVTMPWQVVRSGLAHSLRKRKIRVYAHTVNDLNLFSHLRKMGVFGIYTDYLAPALAE